MIEIIKNLLGLNVKKAKKRVRKSRVLGRLQANCLREAVSHEMRMERPRPAEAKVKLGL